MTPQETLISNIAALLFVGGGGLWMYLRPQELARTYQRILFRSDDVTPRSITWVRRLGMLELILAAIGIVDLFLESVLHLSFWA
jgi:hypothetical protein